MSLITWSKGSTPSADLSEKLEAEITFYTLRMGSSARSWVGEVKRSKDKNWQPYVKLSGHVPGTNIVIYIGASDRKKAIARSQHQPKDLIQLSMNGTARCNPEFIKEMDLVTQIGVAVYKNEYKNMP